MSDSDTLSKAELPQNSHQITDHTTGGQTPKKMREVSHPARTHYCVNLKRGTGEYGRDHFNFQDEAALREALDKFKAAFGRKVVVELGSITPDAKGNATYSLVRMDDVVLIEADVQHNPALSYMVEDREGGGIGWALSDSAIQRKLIQSSAAATPAPAGMSDADLDDKKKAESEGRQYNPSKVVQGPRTSA